MTSASSTIEQPVSPRPTPTTSGVPMRPPVRRRRRPVASVGRVARSIFFWAHLAVGVVTGLVVLVMSATGTAMTFQRQLLDWSASRQMAAPAPGAVRLPLDSLLAVATAALGPDRPISAITVKADASKPVTLGLAARRYAYVNPYTAQLIPASTGLQTFYFEMERWHRAMGMAEGLRGKPGVTITGASNLAFLFLILSGMLLWIPRQASWRAVRAVLLFERGVSGRRRDWNWHHVLGIWAAPVLVLLVVSGVFISYQWPTAMLERVVDGAPARASAVGGAGAGASGSAARGAGGPARGDAGSATTPDAPVRPFSLDMIAARAGAHVPEWRTVQIRMPRTAEAPMTASVSTTTAIRPDRRVALSFAAGTGAMTVEPGYATLSGARRIRAWMRGVHTGEAGGVAGQAAAGLACLAAVVLVWTGIALAWRRFLRAVWPRSRRTAA